ncbi:MAG: hypothetical protein WCG20_02190 [bacterium]
MFFIDDDEDAAWEQERERNRKSKKSNRNGFDMIHAAQLLRQILNELCIPVMDHQQQRAFDRRNKNGTK